MWGGNTKTVPGFLSGYCIRYANQLRTYSERTLFSLHRTFSICQIISSIRAESISMIGALKPKKRLKNFVFSGEQHGGYGRKSMPRYRIKPFMTAWSTRFTNFTASPPSSIKLILYLVISSLDDILKKRPPSESSSFNTHNFVSV